MILKAQLSKFIHVILSPTGYQKFKSASWVKITPDLRYCIELQKSYYSNSYYINIYIMLNTLHPDLVDSPKEFRYDTFIPIRIGEIIKVNSRQIDNDLNFEDEKDDSIKLKQVEAYIKALVNELSKINTLDDLKTIGISNSSFVYGFTLDAKRILGIA